MSAAEAVARLADLVETVARRGPTGPGVHDAALRAEELLKSTALAAGGALTLALAQGSVYVNGTLLLARRTDWDLALRLAELASRIELIELEISASVTVNEILALATSLVAAGGDPRQRNTPFATRFTSLKLTRGEARGDELARGSEAARALHLYASTVTALRTAHRAIENREPLPVRVLKRAALELATTELGPAWLGLSTLARAHRDDAGRAVQTAVVALAIGRELTKDTSLLARLVFAALLTDIGRPMLAALAGRSPDVDASLEAYVPAVTAMVCLAASTSQSAAWRAAITFETAWREREALLGPLHSGELPPSVAAELLFLARAYLDGIAPRDGRPAQSPPAALRRVCERADASPELCAALRRALGELPPGTVLELATREWGVVMGRSASGDPARPLIRLLTDGSGRAHPRPLDLDLGAPASGTAAPGIAGVVPPARARFNVARTFFGSI